MDINYAIDKLVGAVGDIPLAVERYNTDNKKLDSEFTNVSEYQFLEGITANPEACNQLIARYRLLMIIKTFQLLNISYEAIVSRVDDMKPNDIAKMHTSLTQAFTALTNPATKVTFDFRAEIDKIAEELKLSPEEIEADIKAMMAK